MESLTGRVITRGKGNPKHDESARRKRPEATERKLLSVVRKHGPGTTKSAVANKAVRIARAQS